MLLLHLIFLQNLLLFISSISVGRGKLQKERHVFVCRSEKFHQKSYDHKVKGV